MNFVILDFEVFKFDTLLGAIVLEDGKITKYQTWILQDMREFYYAHNKDMWITWNGNEYDIPVLEGIMKHKDTYSLSKQLISSKYPPKILLPIITFDLMNVGLGKKTSLKLTELIAGKSIETSDVDFDIERHLTDEEKRETEQYNMFDLEQTLYNFNKFKDRVELRVDIIKEFNLDLMENLRVTGTTLAANVLKAKKNPSLVYQKIPPVLYPNLQLKNETLINYFLTEGFRKGEFVDITIGDAKLHIGSGGGHSALAKFYAEKCIYIDVNGYYNRIMMEYNLFSRAIPEEGQQLYSYMFVEQNKLKKTNPRKRAVYKTILLSVFGASNNEYTDFYDPEKASLVCITGELFICDLMEKLEPYVSFVQVNTDGLFILPHDWKDEKKIFEIVDELCERTRFVVKKDYIYELYQRDVNNYLAKDDKGEIIFKGEALKNYKFDDESYASGDVFDCKEPPIIAQGIVNWFLNGIEPEDMVEQNKKDLRLFQYACKKGSFDEMYYELVDLKSGKKGQSVGQNVCRAFAYKSDQYSGMLYKRKKDASGKEKIQKVSNLPDSVFVVNNDITNAYEGLCDLIDWNYYVKRIYEKINAFI